MVIVLKKSIADEEKSNLRQFLESKGFKVKEIVGEEETIFGAVGHLTIDIREVEILPGVDHVIPISKPYKLASREFKKEDTIVPVGPLKIGGLRIAVIAGPCAVESREQILESAYMVKECGAVMLRGGAYKPRTSPYAFQGLGEKGIQYLKEAGEATGLPIVTEIVATEHVGIMKEYVDVLQIGARNMQNFELLKKVGALEKPVILKRGIAATIQEWLMAAEYLLAHGADNVILCERGIRTYETYTRNTLDISAIPVVKKLSHLPVIVDPSHATGIRNKVLPMALAAIAAGADGLIVEVHPNPEQALSDGPQSLYPEQFEKLMQDIEALSPVLGKEVAKLPMPKKQQEKRAISVSTEKPDKFSVAFQGEHGAFSEMALYRYFDKDSIEGDPSRNFRDVFEKVLSGRTPYGIIPVENALAGSVYENFDLLLQYPDIKIVGEQKLRIIHNLIGLPGAKFENIRKVFSHPQGFAQCEKFFEEHPELEKMPFYDTAGSVAYVAKEKNPTYAAIASEEATRVYGMEILKSGIETNPRNYTRFFILARVEHEDVSNPNKASIAFSTPDRPGALFACLKVLADKQLNMSRIESRPIAGKPWEYMFFIDLAVPDSPALFFDAMEELRSRTENLRLLGVYRA